MAQHVYATSKQALELLAGAEVVMGAARNNSPSLPEQGNVAAMDLAGHSSLDVLNAPRQCEIHIGSQSHVVELTPRADASIQDITTEALRSDSPTSPQPTTPRSDLGMGRKK